MTAADYARLPRYKYDPRGKYSQERRCWLAPTTRGTVVAVRSRSYCLEAPRPFWQWVRDWRP